MSVYSLSSGVRVDCYSNNSAKCTALTLSADGKEVIAIMAAYTDDEGYMRHIRRWFVVDGALQKNLNNKHDIACDVNGLSN